MPTRRHFLAAATAAPAVLSQTKPNDKIRIALIGAGGMGSGDVNSSLASGESELVAVPDNHYGQALHRTVSQDHGHSPSQS